MNDFAFYLTITTHDDFERQATNQELKKNFTHLISMFIFNRYEMLLSYTTNGFNIQ